MDLVAFLRARLDEDERRAKRANPDSASVKDAVYRSPSCYSGDVVLVAAMNPARVLAEVEAKRRIVELHDPDRQREPDEPEHVCSPVGPCLTLRLLALPYAGHADYQPEWKP